ncbi:DUF1579 domain-containing protein [Tundrisphaera lichenicola]|uniref:DUF1579 domain-containing protein n=1 Tax=Tundrisphaera lichenicola TaxID=2029860 RepID=UPI003EBB8EC6
MRHSSVGFAVVVTLGWLAQAGIAAAQGENPGSPGEEHRRLEPLVGRWDVSVIYKLGPDVERKGTAESEARWVLDGRFLRQDYTSKLGNRPFEVVQFLGFDRRKGKFLELRMDNLDTGLMHNEGTISADGKTITCLGDRIDPASGKSRRLRTVTTLEDADHYTLEWFLEGDDGQEQKTVTLSHTRKRP